MKIKSEHLQTLTDALEAGVAGDTAKLHKAAKAYKEVGLSDKRFLWDVFYNTRIEGERPEAWSSKNLKYLNDENIHTALKHIFKNKALPSKV